ncbi:MAG: 6,7-dimethyl-8-ribityllumazine synthase [Paludibacteraceae bacterium]|nr:6,7-dimethyl-8-ribityllumazine synthase [Bacteroidales bacterium]MDY4512453.1 6,7-dimethyl-8-ribityllumazine synthase [Paludibacteraceae bacterium]MCI7429514.1 6,7-dimethyl-8-ribityllumazine synthase [Bacteroidales bacterium]MDD6781835.1 6,7-dimethyl-8-ribityllumazine synthase [Bacteroidales bacterium]MDD7528977.1 6,7-dimethyl-8-ribityllumazine synthase [Bacteroidales bacterium]
MATKYHNLSDYDATAMPDKQDVQNQHYAIVVADWNEQVTFRLLDGAVDALIANGVKPENIVVKHVPGTFELTFGAKMILREQASVNAVIVIGCVVRGDTPHFDFVCDGVTQGITALNADEKYRVPIIFSVLTTNTMQQALDRAGGSLGNKGVEGAITAIRMANLF